MKVKCIRYTVENDNNDRASHTGLRVGQWYDVLDQKIVDVGNPKFTNPLRYKISVYSYTDTRTKKPVYEYYWFSAYMFTTQREINLNEIGI